MPGDLCGCDRYVSTDYVAMFNDYNRTHTVTEESFRLSPVSYGVQKARLLFVHFGGCPFAFI
jgi:hypothetical protein